METEILQNVLEQIVRNGVLVLFKIMVEALLQVSSHLRRQVANVGLFRRSSAILHLLVCLRLFLVRGHLLSSFRYRNYEIIIYLCF